VAAISRAVASKTSQRRLSGGYRSCVPRGAVISIGSSLSETLPNVARETPFLPLGASPRRGGRLGLEAAGATFAGEPRSFEAMDSDSRRHQEAQSELFANAVDAAEGGDEKKAARMKAALARYAQARSFLRNSGGSGDGEVDPVTPIEPI